MRKRWHGLVSSQGSMCTLHCVNVNAPQATCSLHKVLTNPSASKLCCAKEGSRTHPLSRDERVSRLRWSAQEEFSRMPPQRATPQAQHDELVSQPLKLILASWMNMARATGGFVKDVGRCFSILGTASMMSFTLCFLPCMEPRKTVEPMAGRTAQ